VRRAVTVFALASVAAVLLASASAGRTSATACRAAHLRGHLAGTSGAAGTIVLAIELTNTGAACTMKGYAALALFASPLRPLPTHVVHGGLAILNQKPKLVRLAHNGVATILVAYSDVPTGHESRCPKSASILVKPPGRTLLSAVTVKAPAQACDRGTLRESPVLAGRRKAS
jgi:Domain of unknown function (DUF4232)